MKMKRSALQMSIFSILNDSIDNDRKAIESKANTKEWKVECNSVRNKLQMKNTFDQKEWRQHIEKAKLFSGDLLQIVSGV